MAQYAIAQRASTTRLLNAGAEHARFSFRAQKPLRRTASVVAREHFHHRRQHIYRPSHRHSFRQQMHQLSNRQRHRHQTQRHRNHAGTLWMTTITICVTLQCVRVNPTTIELYPIECTVAVDMETDERAMDRNDPSVQLHTCQICLCALVVCGQGCSALHVTAQRVHTTTLPDAAVAHVRTGPDVVKLHHRHVSAVVQQSLRPHRHRPRLQLQCHHRHLNHPSLQRVRTIA